MNYCEVIVSIKTETESKKKGGGLTIKTVKEIYLVDAMSVTEAEARIVELFSKSGFSQDYEVIAVKSSKIIEVVPREEKKPKLKPVEKEYEVGLDG